MRTLLTTLAAALCCAAPAHAAPRPLARMGADAALAGDNVLLTRVTDRELRVDAIPARGGRARAVFAYQAPRGRGRAGGSRPRPSAPR